MGVSVTKAALVLGVSRKTLSKNINGNSGISSAMAFRLSIAFGGSPESWKGATRFYCSGVISSSIISNILLFVIDSFDYERVHFDSVNNLPYFTGVIMLTGTKRLLKSTV